jgi:hypothetical protein
MERCDTTIALTKITKQRMDEIKIIESETYDHVINRLINEIQKKEQNLVA